MIDFVGSVYWGPTGYRLNTHSPPRRGVFTIPRTPSGRGGLFIHGTNLGETTEAIF